MARGDAETRNKRKNKRRERKKYPYRTGGGRRSMNISTKSGNASKSSKKGKK